MTNASEAGRLLGSIKSEAKAAAARMNGRKGGRPRKETRTMTTMPRFTQVSRDPFARETLIRKSTITSKTCDYCGQNHRGKLYAYGSETDSGRKTWAKGEFCSVQCYRDYHRF